LTIRRNSGLLAIDQSKMNSHSPEQNKDILTCLSHWFIHTNRNFSRRERRNFHGNKCSHDVFKCVFLLVSLRYEQARRKFQAVFLSIKQKIMSSDLELEEFNGLGTALAPRIPNAENRNLELKVNIFNLIIEKKEEEVFIRIDRFETKTLSIDTT